MTSAATGNRQDAADIWKLKEKQTDAHLAISLHRLAAWQALEQTAEPGSLKALAHWMRRAISAEELQAHQFPIRVPTHKAPAIRPDSW